MIRPLRAALLAGAAVLALAPACVALAPPPAPTATAQHPALALLATRDRAQVAGDVVAAAALVAPDAPATFRAREEALARTMAERNGTPPRRAFVREERLGSLTAIVVSEADDQGRERLARHFVTPEGRLSEPLAEALGEERQLEFAGGVVRYRAIDEDQARVAASEIMAALRTLVARLGPTYAPSAPLSVLLRPTAPPELPALASAYATTTEIGFLTSNSMLAASGPGAAWTRTVVGHEVAHALLLPRGSGGFLMTEGLALWLTDDRRQPELDRIVAADRLWSLDQLLRGPNGPGEFFSSYAQASSFVRFVAARHGDASLLAIWEAGRRVPFAEAFRQHTGADAEAEHRAWRASLGR